MYQSFLLLAKKQYSARLFDGTHSSKGISFVRRSGPVIVNETYKKFIHELQVNNTNKRRWECLEAEYWTLHAHIYNDIVPNDILLI